MPTTLTPTPVPRVSESYLAQLQRGVDFIEARLDTDLPLGEVAKAAGMSQWHFQRIFRAMTGETLKAYIRSRRFASSAERLLATDMRILDIALLAGFETQESFTRAFKKAFDATPHEYRKRGVSRGVWSKVRFDEAYIRHLHRGLSLEPRISLAEPKVLVGMRTHFYGLDSEKNNLGTKLPPLWASLLSRVSEIEHCVAGTGYGVVREERADGERLIYDAAFEVTRVGTVPSGMRVLEIPSTTYAVFTHRGEAKTIDLTVSYVYATWLVHSGWRHTGAPDLEIYGPAYHPTDPCSEIGYAVPVEPGTNGGS